MELFSFEQPSCSRTASEKQKRVLRYVKKGRVLKLKSYLGKHPDVQLNFWRGRKQRTPLHLACCLGNDAALRLLLRGGADAARGDRRGNTPLHVAARMALKHAERGNSRQPGLSMGLIPKAVYRDRDPHRLHVFRP